MRVAFSSNNGSLLRFHVRVRWKVTFFSRRMLRSVSMAMRGTTRRRSRYAFSRRNDQCVSGSPNVVGGASAMATIRSRMAGSNVCGRPVPTFGFRLSKAIVVEGVNYTAHMRLISLTDQRAVIDRSVHHLGQNTVHA